MSICSRIDRLNPACSIENANSEEERVSGSVYFSQSVMSAQNVGWALLGRVASCPACTKDDSGEERRVIPPLIREHQCLSKIKSEKLQYCTQYCTVEI